MFDSTGTHGRYRFLVALLGFLVLAQGFQHVYAAMESDYTGLVLDDETGAPIPDADIKVYYRRFYRRYSSRWYAGKGATSDSEGRFQLDLNEDYGYLIIVSHEENGEHDYIPYGSYFTPVGTTFEEEIRLWRSGEVTFEGRDFFIETTAIPEITVRVLDPDGMNPIKYGDIGLYYGTGSGSISSYLDLSSDITYVPTDRDYRIRVTAYSEKNGDPITETRLLDAFEQYPAHVDLQNITLQRNIEKIQNLTRKNERILATKEEQGFFLAVERQKLGMAKTLITSSHSQMETEALKESFTTLREAYVILSDLDKSVSNLQTEATNSVFILIIFIGLTSQIMAMLLFEEDSKKILTGATVFLVLLSVLLWLHPGVQITSKADLIRMGSYTLIGVSILGLITPKILQRGTKTANPQVKSMIIPLFSIAKRSLRRRKLRFFLTLTSVLLLVASFISLTSFSAGFGLSIEKVGNPIGKEGIMVRAPNPPPTKSAAPFSGGIGVSGPLPVDEAALMWFEDDESIMEVTPRYESQPQRQYRESYSPITSVGRVNIFGILSVDPEYEADVNSIDSTIITGNYLSGHVGEVLVSLGLADKLGLGVGDSFSIELQENTYTLTIVGLMDDTIMGELTDIDGDTLLPKKIIEWARIEYDGPDHVVEALAPCDPDEVIVLSHASTINMTSLRMTRVNLNLNPNVNYIEYGRTTALNRGYRVWVSTQNGISLVQLSEYFNGKGLPIVIPWVIVVLNVVVTMMNAYYERRQEVMIFSSIGMNPQHISGIFLAEATVTGILGGCLGYLLGLGAYKFIYLVTPALQVQQKVSAIWSLGAIGISLAAVFVGGVVALRNSVSITPSLRRRWSIEEKENESVTQIKLPVHVFQEEIEEYDTFLNERLGKKSSSGDMRVRMLKREIGEKIVFTFIYSTEGTNISRLYTKNRLIVELDDDQTYSTTLYTEGDSDSIKRAGVLMRKITLDWSMKKEDK